MADMNAIFAVVDGLELSRESIQVPLLPEGSGRVDRTPTGKIEIVVPANRPLVDWLPELERRLRELTAGA